MKKVCNLGPGYFEISSLRWSFEISRTVLHAYAMMAYRGKRCHRYAGGLQYNLM